MGKWFGRSDDDAVANDLWQDCPGCDGNGYTETEKANKKGETVKVNQKCGGCKGSGQVLGGERS